MKREDGGCRKSGQHNDRSTITDRQADRLARFQSNAVSNDPRIGQFADHLVRQVSGSFGRPARQHNRIAIAGRCDDLPQPVDVVPHCSQPNGLASQFLDSSTQNGGVGIVNRARGQRLARRNDFVAGRNNRNSRLLPDFNGRQTQSGQYSDFSRRQHLPES